MAVGTYITTSDITNIHFKQFQTAEKEAYVLEANTYCEDFALTLGVAIEDITVSIIVKRMLATYATMRFAQDSIGTNSVALADGEDMYVELYNLQNKMLFELQAKISPELLSGTTTDRSQRSVSMGRIFRS
jgi:hypothetical protein